MPYHAGTYDIAVIGGGHAGVEAALAAARLNAKCILFTISMDAIANLPCNPSIGGTAKGHLVREIDALGGEMGKAADNCLLQSRMLNRGKGPAVHSLRAQVDRTQYHLYMKQKLENTPGLSIKQAEAVELLLDNSGAVSGLVTALGAVYRASAVIICTGTFLGGRIFIGDYAADSGPDGLHAPKRLSECLGTLGLPTRRFKTGTPARVHAGSIDFSKLEKQPGDVPITPFSYETARNLENIVNCYIAYTNNETHRIIRENLHRSPLYSGLVTGIGARYCPSIEDKVVRFADKERHQVFVEPMGLNTKEVYLQGLSTSLPEDVQTALYRSITGFEQVQIIRSAYAIEYDCIDPLCLRPTLETKTIPGLYGAGQFNGTSGYEEAAAQGLIASVNAVRKLRGQNEIILERASSYIGTLIDDLVTKGCSDPYRMMTSRSEYRLLLRQDNADERLTPIGREIGLISDERWDMFHVKQNLVTNELNRAATTTISATPVLSKILIDAGTSPVTEGTKLEILLRRPELNYRLLAPCDLQRPELSDDVMEQIEIKIKYAGYIEKQQAHVNKMNRLETTKLPEDINYRLINGIRLEAKEKLSKVRPASLGQAARISGVTPSDVSVLMIFLEERRRRNLK